MKTSACILVILGLGTQHAAATTCSAGTYNSLAACLSSAIDGDIVELTADVSVTSSLIVNKNIIVTSDPTANMRYVLDATSSSGAIILVQSTNVSITNLVIQKGSLGIDIAGFIGNSSLNLTNSIIADCAGTYGGGIAYYATSSASKSLTLIGGTIANNTAKWRGGGIYFSTYGISYLEPIGLILVGTTISGNAALHGIGGGGGIYSYSSYGARVSIFLTAGSIVSNNENVQNVQPGSGIYALGDVYVSASTVSGNTRGVGVYAGGSVFLTDAIITSNTHGAVYASQEIAIHSSSVTDNGEYGVYAIGSVSLSEASTIKSNIGAGIYGAKISVTSSLVTDNGGVGVSASGSVSLSDATIASNTGGGVSSIDISVASSSIIGNGGVGVLASGSVSLSDATIASNNDTGVFASGDVFVSTSTISSNSQLGYFTYNSGIYSEGDIFISSSSTISGNINLFDNNNPIGVIHANANVNITSSSVTDNGGVGVSASGSVSLSDATIASNTGGGVSSIDISVASSSIIDNGGVGVLASGSVSLSDATIASNTGGGVSSNHILSTGYAIHDNVNYDLNGPFASTCRSMEEVEGLLLNRKLVSTNNPAGGIPQFYFGNEVCVPCSEGSLHIAAAYSESGQWYCVPFHRTGYFELWITWLSLFGIVALLVVVHLDDNYSYRLGGLRHTPPKIVSISALIVS